jgi:anti-sigma factor RsiW
MSDSADRIAPELLGAYADDELTTDSRREVDAHLARCARCMQELRVQMALKQRLQVEELAPEHSGALARLKEHVAQLGQDAAPRAARGWLVLPPIVAIAGWLIAACLAALWVLGPRQPPGQGMAMSMTSLDSVIVDSVPEPIAEAALHDFRRVAQATLPEGPDLAAVESRVPFSVPALRAPHMRLIGAWTSAIDSVPAAVLAYRCHDRLVLQYVVPEHVFFRPARVRQAIAASALYAAGEGKVHAVGWPGTDNGSLLVGEFTPAELAAMRL